MNKLDDLILFVVDRACKEGKSNLSRFEVFKIIYLIQIESLKFTGKSFVDDARFVRDKNGPISIDVYKAMDILKEKGYLKLDIIENKKYGHPRHAFSLLKKKTKFDFSTGETIFLDSVLSDLFKLSQQQLKEIAYNTEPMKEIRRREKSGKILKGKPIDMKLVSLDPDILDIYTENA
ncbi:MAG: DUF4065 domain-containing protein [Candidatus Pacebacteria bacterium]|nr:DUF4065 domain-containing protein [Candidatus Paceibacterota bacterium]